MDASPPGDRFTGFGLLLRSRLTARALQRLDEGDLFAIAPPGYGKSALLENLRGTFSHNRNLYALPDADGFDARTAEEAEIVLIDRADAAGPKASRAIDAWLRAPGRRARALVAARRGEGLPAAQLVAEGRAAIWRAGDLAFTVGEIAEFLKTRGCSAAPERTAAALFQRAEGWPLATALLAEDAAANPRRARLPANLPPALREGFDALLARLPKKIDAEALALAALPDQIHGGLFHALTGSAAFAALTGAGLDLQEVQGAPGWWRFARLFRQYLRERAQGLGRDRIGHCQRRIAEWYLTEGHLPDAALHALETGDRRFALATIDKAARQFIAYGEIAHARTWLDHLEPDDRSDHPEMWLHTVTALALSGEVDRTKDEIARLRRFLNGLSDMKAKPGWYDEVRLNLECNAQIAALFDPSANPDPAALDTLLADPAAPDYAVHGEAQAIKGLMHLEAGTVEQARHLLTACAPVLRKTRSWYGLAMVEAALARFEAKAGQVEEAYERCQAAEAGIIEALGFSAPCLLPLVLTRAEGLVLAGELGLAEDLLTAHEKNLRTLMNPVLLAHSHMIRGLIHLAHGHPAEARTEADLGFVVVKGRNGPSVKAGLRLVQTLASLRMNDVVAARTAVGPSFGLAPPARISGSGADFARLVEAGLTAAVLAAEGQAPRAARQFTSVHRMAKGAGENRFTLELELLRLETGASRTDSTKTKRALKTWSESTHAAGLEGLVALARAGPLRNHFPDGSGARARTLPAEPAPGSLSDLILTQRENEVLSLIALGYTNHQIAVETVTALTTVKWHVRNIFGKLGVHTRTAAVARAKALGLAAAG